MLLEMERQQVHGEDRSHGSRQTNVLSGETTFIMGILKKGFMVQEVPPSEQNNSNSASGTHQNPGFSNIELPSMEAVNQSQNNSLGNFQMKQAEEAQISINAGSKLPSLNTENLPLLQEIVETTYAWKIPRRSLQTEIQ